MDKAVRRVLEAARTRIADPAQWTQGMLDAEVLALLDQALSDEA